MAPRPDRLPILPGAGPAVKRMPPEAIIPETPR